MKKLMIMWVLVQFILAGCGGGGGGGSADQTAPAIANLQFTPTAAYANSGGGTVNVSGTFDFSDPNGNLASLTIIVQDALGQLVDTSTSPISNAGGVTAGSIMISGSVPTTVIETYTFLIRVTDTSGLVSNTLTGSFRVADVAWRTRAAMTTPRVGFAVTALNGQIYAIGGEGYDFAGYSFDPAATVEAYNPANNSWTARTPMPTARKGPAIAAVNGIIYVFGGQNLPSPGGLTTVEAYDPLTDSWSTKAPMPTARCFSTASVVSGIVYVMGGTSGGFDLATVEAYDPATDSWVAKAPLPTPRRNLASAAVNGKIYAIGGYGTTSISGYLDTVEQYDPATNSWSTRTPVPTGAEYLAAGVINGKIYVVGGDNALNRALDMTVAYDPASDTWQTKTAMPGGLSPVSADVSNSLLYAVGGLITYEYTAANEIL